MSEDPTTGTNQKASAFWTRVHLLYNKNIAKANKNRESDPDWRYLPTGRPKGSLKSQWYTRLQPSIQKFAGIVAKHPPASGQLKDDPDMDLYWKSMRLLYSNQAKEGLPKKFSPYMQAYFFLTNHPKFASVLEENEKSGAEKKGYRQRTVSDRTSPEVLNSSRKLPSAAVVNSERPVGRDSAKKKKATDFVVEKVSEGISKAMGVMPQRSEGSLKHLEEGLQKANDIMQTMANHQVMAMAPPNIREQYFSEVFDLINAQARNKRLRLEMENEEILMRMKKIDQEKESNESGKEDDNLKMPAKSTETNIDNTQDSEGTTLKCCYPDCLFAFSPGGGPNLDDCQGKCGKKKAFHHACNVSWLESRGVDADLRKLCHDCVVSTFADV